MFFVTADASPTPDWMTRFNQGISFNSRGDTAAALDCFADAARLNPGLVQAHVNIGVLAQGLGRDDQAATALETAVRLKPDHADALSMLTNLYIRKFRIQDALQPAGRLLSVRPDYPGAHITAGNLFMHIDTQDRAENAYRCAVVLDPGSAVAYNNLGAARTSQLKLPEGAAAYRRAIILDPQNPEYNKNLGCCLLLDSKFEEGTRYYEWRSRQTVWKWNRSFPGKPEWDGSPLDGKTILVHFEQGLGDSFQYIRYMPVLKAMGAKVIYECQPALKRILSSAPGCDALVAHGDPLPEFDTYITLMSLMQRLGTDADNTPGGVPYLHPELELKKAWRSRMNLSEFRIGVNWQGNEVAKSIPLDFFVDIAAIPGVRLYSLQKVKGLEHLERLRDRLPLIDWTAEMDTGKDGFIDTAAVMSNMDLILTCDTSVAHLAGGLGLRTWMVLKWFADWRWMKDRPDSPWYPTMRIFRMARKNDWAGVMERVTRELRALSATERAGDSA
jgi:Flp pilus assembly protein TadD